MPRVIRHHGYTVEEIEGTSKWALFFPGDSLPHGISDSLTDARAVIVSQLRRADADGLTP